MEKLISNNLYDNQELLKGGSTVSQNDMIHMREAFIVEYSKNKGWDKSTLTSDQMLEIVSSQGYKTPGMIRS